MLFNSFHFLLFFPIVLLIYYVLPVKVRYIWLLFSSYYFYMCWNVKYVVLLIFSTIVTYISGLLIDKIKNCQRWEETRRTVAMKWCVAGSFFCNLSVLFFFKYFNFLASTLNNLLKEFAIDFAVPSFDVLLPVGISFYMFQALSYTMDVYRGEIYAERNVLRYALFVSFFPQLVAGPIERSKNLLKQLSVPRKLSWDDFRTGLLLMLWGYFMKLVVADRIALFVDTVYGDYQTYGGCYLVVATALFAIQIYCDFAGYSTIAIGSSRILGIRLMENFNAPYFAQSVSEFWRRWHISLSTWFRDYLYIPLGGNRKGTVRKYLNIMIVFLVSGLWHGAEWSFVVWGGLNGIYQVLGALSSSVRNKISKMPGINRDSFSHKLMKTVVTFCLVDFAWIFFRADTMKDAIHIIRSMFLVKNPWIIFDGSLYLCGLDEKNFCVLMIAILILLVADYCKYKGICISNEIIRQEAWFRWLFFAIVVNLILLFGIWGASYDPVNFIYFQF